MDLSQTAMTVVVFPTCVGVFLADLFLEAFIRGLPHVRGGVSMERIFRNFGEKSSPRAWGCFSRLSRTSVRKGVFPTCVGVFRDP